MMITVTIMMGRSEIHRRRGARISPALMDAVTYLPRQMKRIDPDLAKARGG
jgi:hypothetical protein